MDAKNPASNNVPTPTDEEDLELVEYEDIYCENKSKTINNMVNDDPPPPDFTIQDSRRCTTWYFGDLCASKVIFVHNRLNSFWFDEFV